MEILFSIESVPDIPCQDTGLVYSRAGKKYRIYKTELSQSTVDIFAEELINKGESYVLIYRQSESRLGQKTLELIKSYVYDLCSRVACSQCRQLPNGHLEVYNIYNFSSKGGRNLPD